MGREMRVTVANDSQAGAWDAYVAGAETATFYHCYAWKKALERAYGLKTFYLMAGDDGTPRGVLPLAATPGRAGRGALVSTPYANYGGVLADSHEAQTALINAAAAILEDSKYAYLEMKQLDPAPTREWIERRDYRALVLPLAPDPGRIWTQRLNSKVRNQTRKALKQKMEVRIGPEHFADFRQVYLRNLRDLGTPPHSARWYGELEDLFRERMTAVVACLDGRPVAGAWLFCFRDTVLMHAAASLREFQRLCPNNLVYWKCIEWAARAGYARLDFCRSRIGAGTYHFKEQWGAIPTMIYNCFLPGVRKHIPDLDPYNPRYKAAIAVWRIMPLGLANRIGPLLRRRITT